jgi:hypothetical protein
MTDAELQNLLTAANPLPAERAADLRLDEAQHLLLAELLAGRQPERSAIRGMRVRRRRRFARVALPIAATAVVLVALLVLRDGSSDPGSGTAWAAEQVRFAEASPLVLLDVPGRRVEYADEQSRQEGELQFRLGPTPPPEDMKISPGTGRPGTCRHAVGHPAVERRRTQELARGSRRERRADGDRAGARDGRARVPIRGRHAGPP